MSKQVVLVNENISKACQSALTKEGFIVLKVPSDPSVGRAVCSHPDTLFFSSGGRLIATEDHRDLATVFFDDLKKLLPDLSVSFIPDKRSSAYPDDCILNALVIGKNIFCKTNSIAKEILRFAESEGYSIIHTPQGYPACTVLSFGNKAITADRGMEKILRQHSVDVTFIRNGYISLPPFDYGFIGGASFVFDRNVYFFGDIFTHPDAELIISAISDAGYTAISLSDESLTDLGGALAF